MENKLKAKLKYLTRLDDNKIDFILNEIKDLEQPLYFLANILHETIYLSTFEENLNYKNGERLKAVYPSFFKGKSNEYISLFLQNPKALGDLVYGGRYGNGNGEGYKYRGRGALMTTFKANYIDFDKKTGYKFNVTQNPDVLLNFDIAIKSAVIFYKGINDKSSLQAVRKAINNGFAYEQVKYIYNQLIA